MLALKQLIDKNNIISFDIFDTLILRNIFQPTDIFRILAKFAKDEFDIDDFFQKRVEGEKKARDKVKNSEADFQEIYDEVEKLCGCNIEKIKQMELQLEMEFSVINPYMMEIWKYASEQKKTIIFISDMYLSSDFIKKLLKKNGYKVEHLYVSNEYRKNKGSKELYELVGQELNCKKTNWLHIGDNEYSDYKQAKEFGINAYHYKNVSTYYEGTKELSISESVLIGIQNNYLYNGIQENYWNKFGAKNAFPIYFGFAKWLYDLTKEEDNLFFLARDGYIIKKIYDMFCKMDENTIFTNYIYVSRKVLQLPLLGTMPELDKVIRQLTDRTELDGEITLRETLYKVGIRDMDKAEKYMNAFGFLNLDEIVSPEKLYMAQNLIVKLSGEVRKYFSDKRKLLERYFEQEKVNCWNKLNVMDVGWKGSSQEVIEKILGKDVIGYYFGTADTLSRNKFCTMYGWIFDDWNPTTVASEVYRYINMYELLFSAPHGSTIDYKEENEKIIPVLNDNVIFNQVIKEFQETALELCKVAIKYNDYMDIINPVVATEQYRKFLEEKNEDDIREFEELTSDFLIGNSKNKSYVAKFEDILKENEIQNNNLQHMRDEKDKVFWSGAYIIENEKDIDTNEKELFHYRLMNPVYDKDVYNEYFEYNLKYARVYFDFGSGFSEADSVIVPMQNKGKHYLLGLKLNLEVQSVRIDPIEHEYIRFRNYSFKIDNQKMDVSIPHVGRFQRGEWKRISSQDPCFIVNMNKRRISTIVFDSDLEIISE
ncbi:MULTISPECIES: HAD-IA family hydrolase [Dorea]|jgi:HAD superfamily hydrolase (TIGR01549 family)|uniref:HAD family hydrolase n=1 Tax=Dorea TaxID=189330 RepID=UPI0022E8552A|nr:HAD-IA family hydrolase [Dorea amylophila]